MKMKRTICVGTAGTAVWMSDDLGGTWTRTRSHAGLYVESRVWALSHHPADPAHVLAGTDTGLYRWSDPERTWTHIPSPMDGQRAIWSIARRADTPDAILAGTCPGKVFRSDDGGASWRELAAGIEPFSDFTAFDTRVTRVLFDPDQPDTLWASVEVDQIHRSLDGGQTWERLGEGLNNPDIHDIAVLHDAQGRRLLAVTSAFGTHFSRDEGRSWQLNPIDAEWQYSRTIVQRADGRVFFLTNGDGPPGSTGHLWRSRDDCRSWEEVAMPQRFNSTPWVIATNPADPMFIVMATNLGQVFISHDGGERWQKIEREFGEIRSLIWCEIPAEA